MWGLIVEDRQHRTPRRRSLPTPSLTIHDLRVIAAPVTGLALILAVWVWGGRAGWASGMIVTPDRGHLPDRRRQPRCLLPRDPHDGVVRRPRARHRRVAGLQSPLSWRPACRGCGGSSSAWRRSPTPRPWVAVAPCLLIVLGRDRGPVAVAAIAVFFFVFVSTSVGLGAASTSVHDVAGALGASRFRRVWSVQLPASWPSVADGLKLAAPASLAGAVFGEWYGAERGLGVLLITAMQGGRAERLWAASLLSAACGLTAYGLLAAVRALAVRRFGSEIAQQPAAVPRRHGRIRHIAHRDRRRRRAARRARRAVVGVGRGEGHLTDRRAAPVGRARRSGRSARRLPLRHVAHIVDGGDRPHDRHRGRDSPRRWRRRASSSSPG